MTGIESSALRLIGKTPIVRLDSASRRAGARILAKCEFMNPSGSIKDRIALRMVEDAEKSGKLKPGYTIVEASTGNTGIALSFVGGVKGYKVHIFETMPGKMSRERIKIMQSYGAQVTLVTAKQVSHIKEKSISGAETEVPGRIMCKELEETTEKVWWSRQFSNPSNVQAHYQTGKEILVQTNAEIDSFVASIGTGGTLMGIAEAIRKKKPKVRIVGVQPASSKMPIRLDEEYPKSDVIGGIISEMLQKRLIDEIFTVNDKDAVSATHRLQKEEGLFVGISSGANVLAAMNEARKMGTDSVIATVLPDRGDRYLYEEHYVT